MDDCEPCVVVRKISSSSSRTGLDRSGITIEIAPMPIGDMDPATEEAQEQAIPPLPSAPKPKRQIMMLPSVFEGMPPVILFTYTQACLAPQRPLERMVLADINGPKMYYSHTDAVHEYNAVINSLRQGGLYRVKSENRRWSLLWSSHPPPELLRTMKPNQKTNHFPGSQNLGRKDMLWRNISRMHRRFGRTYNITPQGYILPKGNLAWEQSRQRQPDALWIWKPCSASCGRGIKVLSNEIGEEDGKDMARKRGIVQRYIPNPLLISRRKFDMRIYVLVTSFRPLRAWLYREGFARFSGSLFSMDKKDIANTFIHLTNVAIQKTAEGYDKSKGCKWLFSRVKGYMQTMFGHEAVEQCIKDMQSVIMTSLQSVQPVMIQDSHCFELYGYDILLDDTLKPWLIEVNASPSLSADTKDDYKLKYGMLEDMFGILTLGKVGLDQNYRRVGGFDLMWNDGEVEEVYNEDEMLSAQPITASRFGGYMADRKQHLDHVLSEAKINMRTRMTSDKSFMSSNMASSGSKT